MIRVGLFLASAPHDGGAFQYGQSVLHALAADLTGDMTTTVFYTNDAWREQLASLALQSVPVAVSAVDQLLLKCVKFGLMPLTLWRPLAPKINHVARAVAARECDVWVFPSQDVWSYFLPVPAIVSVFDLMHRYEPRFPEVSSGFKRWRRERHYKRICKAAAGVLVDSSIGRQHVQDSYGVETTRIHELPFTAPPHVRQNDARGDGDLGLPQKFLFYPAQFWSHKNHLRLLRALAKLVEECPDVRLILVGSKKNNYSRVEQLIGELELEDRVHVLGYVSDRDMVRLYANARALVFPSFFGPTNIPPLEAMALGCPVAASDVYAMSEQLGDAALLFDPTSVEEIADAMRRLWTDDSLCARLADRGLAQSARWTQAEFSERLRDIICKVLT